MSKEIIIIGGGVIGLCSAYYLYKEGYHVTIIDQTNMDEGASYINAGYLAPSHIIPLSAPGVMKKGLRWMFNASSPLYIKPSLDLDFLRWVWAFNKSCSADHVERAIPIIKEISVLSQELFQDIKLSENFNFHYDKKGLLMLCQTEKTLKSELKVAQLANEIGLEAREIDQHELQKLEPNVKINALGAVYFKCDHHTTPNEFMDEMKDFLVNSGVKFLTNEKVENLETKGSNISAIITNKQKLKADGYVLTAGSWSNILSKKIGIKLLLQAGKGYSMNTLNKTGLQVPAILTEAKVAVTPMNGFTRFGGTMEIAGINRNISKVRVEAISKAVARYYPDIQLTDKEKNNASLGLRPVSHDGLPFIGKSQKCDNLTIATGHAMMGWSMATATGKLIQEIISGSKLSMNIDYFSPDRN